MGGTEQNLHPEQVRAVSLVFEETGRQTKWTEVSQNNTRGRSRIGLPALTAPANPACGQNPSQNPRPNGARAGQQEARQALRACGAVLSLCRFAKLTQCLHIHVQNCLHHFSSDTQKNQTDTNSSSKQCARVEINPVKEGKGGISSSYTHLLWEMLLPAVSSVPSLQSEQLSNVEVII